MAVLTDELIDRRRAYIEQTCEEYNIDNVDELISLLKEAYEEVSEDPFNKKYPPIRLLNKALGKVCANLGTTGGERFQVLILAYGRPKDWNKKEYDQILDAWGKGIKSRENLKKEGKVITIKINGKDTVVSEVTRWERTNDGKYVALSGKEIEEGEMPIPRDTHEYYSDGKTINKKETWPLTESWNINVYGLAKISETEYKPFIANIYNEWANPSSDKYLPKIAPAFNVYKANFGVDEKKTTADRLTFNYITAIGLDKKITDTSEMIIYNLVEQKIIGSYKEEKGKINPNKFYMVDLDDLKEFHDEMMALHDDDGGIIKGDTGYDKVHWDRFGIGIYYLTSKKETKKGNFSLRFRDWTNATNGGFTNEIIDMIEIEDEKLPIEYIVAFSTTRKPTRWDSKNSIAINDPINGDISFNSILGLKKTQNAIAEGE